MLPKVPILPNSVGVQGFDKNNLEGVMNNLVLSNFLYLFFEFLLLVFGGVLYLTHFGGSFMKKNR